MVVVDIDGTIADCKERVKKYLSGEHKDWDGFYDHCGEDKPIGTICDLVEYLSNVYPIVFVTGRRESCRQETEKWLKFHLPYCAYQSLLMRKDGDTRHDTIVKPELLITLLPKYQIDFILEDRNSMVKKWRELGFTCLQVAEGDF